MSALETLTLAERGAAFVMEALGDLGQALVLRESTYKRMIAANRDRATASRADAVRGLWIVAGDRGNYRSLFEANPGQDDILNALAAGWRNHAEAMETFGGPIPSRLEAVGKALELNRRLAVANPSPANRLSLALSLGLEGNAFRAAARFSDEREWILAYQHGRGAYAEASGILTSLKQSGQLSIAGDASLIALTSNLADAGERLREGYEARAISRR